MPHHPPTLIAHRGLHRGTGLPENSLAAFEAAWAAGVTWCECDVQFTADRRAVVLHDATLHRTTTGAGRADLLPWDAVRKLKLLDADGLPTPHGVPLLHDVLQAAADAGGKMLVEIKPPAPQFHHIATLLLRLGRPCAFQSFDVETVAAMRDAGLGEHVSLLVDEVPDAAAAVAAAAGCRSLNARHDQLDANLVARARQSNLELGAWTVNDPAVARRLGAIGIEWIITNDPVGLTGG